MQPIIGYKGGKSELRDFLQRYRASFPSSVSSNRRIIKKYLCDLTEIENCEDFDESLNKVTNNPALALALIESTCIDNLFSDEFYDQAAFMSLYHKELPADTLIFTWDQPVTLLSRFTLGANFYYAKSDVSLIFYFQSIVRYAYHFGGVYKDSIAFKEFCLHNAPGIILLNREPSNFEVLLIRLLNAMGVHVLQIGERWLEDLVFPFYSDLDLPSVFDRLYRDKCLHFKPYKSQMHQSGNNLQTTWGGGYNSIFVVRSMGGVDGVDVRGESYSDIGVIVDIGDSDIDVTMTGFIESRLIELLNESEKVRVDNTDWFKVYLDSTRVNLKELGNLIYSTIKSEFNFKQVSVSVVCDPYRLASLKPAILAYRENRDKEINKQDELNSSIYLCTRCRSYARNHFCIVTSERPPHCGRSYDMIKTLAHATESAEYIPVKKGELLDRRRGEFAGINKIARLMTGGKISRVFLHSLKNYPHPSSAEFEYIAFYIPRLEGIGVVHRGYTGTTPDGRTWDELEAIAVGRQVHGVAAVSLAYIQSRQFLAADGGAANILWMSSFLKDKLDWHDRLIATERECTNLTTLRNFYRSR